MRPLLRVLLVACCVLLVIPAFSQDRNAFPFVDLGRAQTIIDTLKKENETLQADSDQVHKQIDSLKAQITDSRKGSDDLSPLLDEVRARSSELATIADGVVDRSMKAKAAAAAEKSNTLSKRLAQRLNALGQQVHDWGQQVQALTDQASIDAARIIRNTEDIIVLQATVAKTQAQQARLTEVIEQIETLTGKVDAALK